MSEVQQSIFKERPLHPLLVGGAILLLTSIGERASSYLYELPCAYPGDDPPIYFIRQDFLDGLFAIAGLIVFFLLVLTFYREQLARALYWGLIPLAGLIVSAFSALAIAIQSENLFDPTQVVVAWATSEEYFRDYIIHYGGIAFFLLSLLILRLFYNPNIIQVDESVSGVNSQNDKTEEQ